MKIGIVSESQAVALALRRWLTGAGRHHVAWSAADGREAVGLAATRSADIVLMDLGLSRPPAAETTRQIMATAPCAILIVTDSVATNAATVFEAMGCGALDAIDMPAPNAPDSAGQIQALLVKLDRLSRLVCDADGRQAGAGRGQTSPKVQSTRLLTIGASAGGPAALATLLAGLPQDFPAAIVIVQHVDAQFAGGLADWLGRSSRMPVRIARDGDTLDEGHVLVAGTDEHLVLTPHQRLALVAEPADHTYKPSIDVLFQSACRHWRGDIVGVLLTGMGRDGAVGLKALRDRGGHTIAQDEATSALFGMPRAAIALGGATDVLPIEGIAPRLIDLMATRTGIALCRARCPA